MGFVAHPSRLEAGRFEPLVRERACPCFCSTEHGGRGMSHRPKNKNQRLGPTPPAGA